MSMSLTTASGHGFRIDQLYPEQVYLTGDNASFIGLGLSSIGSANIYAAPESPILAVGSGITIESTKGILINKLGFDGSIIVQDSSGSSLDMTVGDITINANDDLTLSTATDRIVLDPGGNLILPTTVKWEIPVSGVVVGAGLNNTGFSLKYNFNAITAPAITDDGVSGGYVVGSRWINTVSLNEYVCLDNSAGAAVWKITTYH
jgi:hypothetical protein